METYTRSNQSQQIPQSMGDVHRFQGRLLPHTHTEPVKEIVEISCPRQNIAIQSTVVWPAHSSLGVNCCGQTDGFTEGYKNPPVPRRLVGPDQVPPNLSPTYTSTSSALSGPRLASKQKIILKNQNWTPSKFLTL